MLKAKLIKIDDDLWKTFKAKVKSLPPPQDGSKISLEKEIEKLLKAYVEKVD